MPKWVHEDTLRPCVKCGRIAYPELRVRYLTSEWAISISCDVCGASKIVLVKGLQTEWPTQDVLDTIEAWNVENPKEEKTDHICRNCKFWRKDSYGDPTCNLAGTVDYEEAVFPAGADDYCSHWKLKEEKTNESGV